MGECFLRWPRYYRPQALKPFCLATQQPLFPPRTFHRTTSAQATLDEADAILAEIGEEKKLEELKEKAKNNKKKRRQDEEEEEDMDVTPADGGNEEEMPDLDRQQ